ncbi:MAG TPA: DUF2865 domain-containing protein [Pseudorhodoplanes sp.]|nr:DUF2865 domain-containing protein [Pseudorhodoplanes sp.]
MRLRNFVIFAAFAGAGLAFSGGASAQGLFDFFFGFGRRPSPPPQVQPYADPFRPDEGRIDRREAAPSGTYASYCVRLCDGRFFPLPRNGGNAAESCNSFCPAAKTKVFTGSGIEHAVADDGTRYSDLDNAFAYRDRIADNCTCNGRTPYALARMSLSDDPTLRPGDIVATNQGMAVYRGSQRGVAQFTPIDRSRVSSEMRNRLAHMRVQPEYDGEDAATPETSGAAAAADRREKRSQR